MSSDKNALAEDRTDLAEDRTSLANERTFAGWTRTAMAAIGIGIGFSALFGPAHPTWAPKAIATAFILLAIFVIVTAERRAHILNERLTAHQVRDLSGRTLKVISGAITACAIALIAAIWWLT